MIKIEGLSKFFRTEEVETSLSWDLPVAVSLRC